MTVKEAAKMMPGVNAFNISFQGSTFPYLSGSLLHQKTFGDMDVGAIYIVDEHTAEFELATCIMKNGVPI